MPVHYSNPMCDKCGSRHAADHTEECRDILLSEVLALRHDVLELEAQIAAAPELLAACKNSLRDFNTINDTLVKVAGVHPYSLAVKQLRVAIARAEPEGK